MSRRYQAYWPFARAVQSWPVRSPAVRRHLALHEVCPDCGRDVPKRRGEQTRQCACGWAQQDAKEEA